MVQGIFLESSDPSKMKQQMQKFSKGDIVLLKIEGNRNQYPMAKELEKMQMTGFRSKRSIVTCKFLW